MDNLQLQQIIQQHGDDIFTFFIHLTGDSLQAEELYQDTFLKAIEKDELDFSHNPKSYLLGMGINLWKNKRRKDFLRLKKVNIMPLSQREEFYPVADDSIIEEDIRQKEITYRVQQAIGNLPDKYKSVVLLYYMQDMPVKEISHMLGIPRGTVKTRLYKARSILKKQLEDLI